MLKTLVLITANRYRQEQISFLRSVPDLDLLEPVETLQAFWQTLSAQRPDLVILDEVLFSDSGLGLFVRLKSEFPEIISLVFAEKYQQIQVATTAGADRVLLRGFSAKEFFVTIGEIHSMRKIT
jgi:DNA-binding response OmpR family regulator